MPVRNLKSIKKKPKAVGDSHWVTIRSQATATILNQKTWSLVATFIGLTASTKMEKQCSPFIRWAAFIIYLHVLGALFLYFCISQKKGQKVTNKLKMYFNYPLNVVCFFIRPPTGPHSHLLHSRHSQIAGKSINEQVKHVPTTVVRI